MTNSTATNILGSLTGLTLFFLVSSSAGAWESRVFEGEDKPLTTSDLYPRIEEQKARFYAEDFSVTLDLNKGVKAEVKFGISNLVGDGPTGFVSARWRGPRVGVDRAQRKLPSNQWSFEKSPFELSLKPLKFRGNEKKMTVTIEGKKSRIDLQLSALVPGWRPGDGRIVLADQGLVEMMVWPLMEVQGSIEDRNSGKVLRFKGTAIVTHSVTTLPPQFQPPRWFYFKGEDSRNPVLFQAVELGEEFGNELHGWILVVKNNKIMAHSASLELKPLKYQVRDGVKLPWGFYFSDPVPAIEGALQADELTRAVDQLKKLPPLEAAVVGKFLKPVTYFFKGQMEVRVGGESITTKGTYKVEQVR